jgi:carbohydrate kinase (thermoresistant glucokinase family)
LEQAFQISDLAGQRVLVLIPDGTRTAPIPLLFRLLHQVLDERVKCLDYLIALGTHSALDEVQVNRLLGISGEQRRGPFARHLILQHSWDRSDSLTNLGTLTPFQTQALSEGLLSTEVPVRINRRVLDYDLLLVCGPVFPHEVAGFSGGSKYFFPGISGPEMIDFTHWLAALQTNWAVIGRRQTAVRAVIEQAAAMIPRSKMGCALVTSPAGLHGMWLGEVGASWASAVQLSEQVHIRYLDHPVRQALAVLPEMYTDLWTGAKGMYKLEPVMADGGEVILRAPHIHELSSTHGAMLEQLGYHVRDYYVSQWDRFKGYPWCVLAHSTHLRGLGTFSGGVEQARIRVTLATGIDEQICSRVHLGYRQPQTVGPEDFNGREQEGVLLVPRAGETLFRLKPEKGPTSVIIVMGVSGSGKTTVGRLLAERLGWTFLEADDFHPRANIAKMRQGVPLQDEDRWGWLEALAHQLREHLDRSQPVVLACSALKQDYRDILRVDAARVEFVYLHGPPELIHSRMQSRSDHFMLPSMLNSQLASLEEPSDALVLEIDRPAALIVEQILTWMRETLHQDQGSNLSGEHARQV